MRRSVRFCRNGRVIELSDIRPGLTLLDYLRLIERQTGTKSGCTAGSCGACTILLGRIAKSDLVYEPAHACSLLVAQADGCDVVAVEDIADDDGALHPVQEALIDHHATRCGFCTAGMAMSLAALYHQTTAKIDESEVRRAIQSNTCRCTGYRSIVAAGVAAGKRRRETRLDRMREETRTQLEALSDDEDIFLGTDDAFVALPTTLERAAALCLEYPAAMILAGGAAADAGARQRSDLERIILLSRVAEARRIALGETSIVIGAAVSLQAIIQPLHGIDPDLAALVRRIGGRQHRSLATIGGDLMLGARASDVAAALIALGAEVVFQIGSDRRRVALESIYAADGSVERDLGELMVEVHIPRSGDRAVFRCFKVSRRWDQSSLIVSGGFLIGMDTVGAIDSARIAFTGIGVRPARAYAAEAALVGAQPLDRAMWTQAFSALRADIEAVGDGLGSARYRTETAQALLGKALIEAGGTSDSRTRLRGFRREDEAVAAG